MTISRVGGIAAAATTAVPPAHAVGDLILVFASRSGNVAPPTVPAGYTSLGTKAGTSISSVLAYRIATATNDAGGTWTNATGVVFEIYRSSSGNFVIAANSAASSSSTTSTVAIPSLSNIYEQSGMSWAAGFVGNSSSTNITTAPTGMTFRDGTTTGTGRIGSMDTNGGVTGWVSANVTLATANSTSWTVEIVDGTQMHGAFDVRNLARGVVSGQNLSNLDKTALEINTGGVSQFSTDAITTQKSYLEYTETAAGTSPNANEMAVNYSTSSGAAGSVWWDTVGGIIGSNLNSAAVTGFTITAGHVRGMAVDPVAGLVWFRDATTGGNWNNSGTANPATGVGGIAFTTSANPLYFVYGKSSVASGGTCTVNTGVSAFVGAMPSGFSAWYGPPPWVLSGAAVDLDFADGQYWNDTLANLISCSNSTGGYVTNTDGSLSKIAANTPRIGGSSSTTNLLLHSQDMATGGWNFVSSNSSLTDNQATAPDGTLTADYFAGVANTGAHYTTQAVTKAAFAITYTFSIYAKAAQYTRLEIALDDGTGTNGSSIGFDLSGAQIAYGPDHVGYTNALTNVSGSVQSVGNGWVRCAVTATSTTGTTIRVGPQLDNGTGTAARSDSFLGSTSSGIYVWGAQLEPDSTVSDYCKTTTAAASQVNFDGNGTGLLVEEARTNLLLQSQFATSWTLGGSTVTANSVVAPDLTTTAARYVEDTTNTFHNVRQNVAKAASSLPYTLSCYVKPLGAGSFRYLDLGLQDNGGATGTSVAFDPTTGLVVPGSNHADAGWTITSFGSLPSINGFRRYWLSVTSDTTAFVQSVIASDDGSFASYTGDGVSGLIIWGAQLEQAAFPTSDIPTTTAAVTRPQDVVRCGISINAVLSVAAGGSELIASSGVADTSVQRFLLDAFPDASTSTTAFVADDTHATSFWTGNHGINPVIGTGTFRQPFKFAAGWDTGGGSAVANGGTVAVSGFALTADPNYAIGTDKATAAPNCYFTRIALWQSRLPDATLQSLTAVGGPTITPAITGNLAMMGM
jgi:hypothetical protein